MTNSEKQKKLRWRRCLAALPIEEKFKILVKMQVMAKEVAIAVGRKPKEPWHAYR